MTFGVATPSYVFSTSFSVQNLRRRDESRNFYMYFLPTTWDVELIKRPAFSSLWPSFSPYYFLLLFLHTELVHSSFSPSFSKDVRKKVLINDLG
ncbi:hypothetical protein CDAR_24581 [Caerostris darwini]|uniref:Uncharacterized protein n=1 Tax=Caerostris darwini TaxID=1538125 RepID=A0AAV4UV52_9ARAC|nr:hypothetical protein CDAR_24581 [Caerostris darwini]